MFNNQSVKYFPVTSLLQGDFFSVNQQTQQVWQICKELMILKMFFDFPLAANIVQSIDK